MIFAVGHLAALIEAYFGDGSHWGVQIEYAREDRPLGTAGPLGLLKKSLPSDFLVVNGDVISDLDFRGFLLAHRTERPRRLLTIATHQRVLQSEYGVLETAADGQVRAYSEKPSYTLRVSEGVYAFSRAALDWISAGERMDFPELVVALLQTGESVVAWPHTGLWLDIGRPEDYDQAQDLVSRHPHLFAALTRGQVFNSEPIGPSLPDSSPGVDGAFVAFSKRGENEHDRGDTD